MQAVPWLGAVAVTMVLVSVVFFPIASETGLNDYVADTVRRYTGSDSVYERIPQIGGLGGKFVV